MPIPVPIFATLAFAQKLGPIDSLRKKQVYVVNVAKTRAGKSK